MKWMDWTAEGDVHKVTGDLDQEDEGLQETLILCWGENMWQGAWKLQYMYFIQVLAIYA